MSPKYNRDSLGSKLRMALATVKPPMPESNMPIGFSDFINIIAQK